MKELYSACLVPRCQYACTSGMIFCDAHWDMIPGKLRAQLAFTVAGKGWTLGHPAARRRVDMALRAIKEQEASLAIQE